MSGLPVIPTCGDCRHRVEVESYRVVGSYQATWEDNADIVETERWYECRRLGHDARDPRVLTDDRPDRFRGKVDRVNEVKRDEPPPDFCPFRK